MRSAEFYDAYLAAVLAADRREAIAVLRRAETEGLGLAAIYLEVLQPALREIGRLWQENEISVADEHLATAISQSAMARLYDGNAAVTSAGGRSLIAACADVERHEVGLRMICDLLELEGWATAYLGGSVPIDSLISIIQKKRPDVLLLSVALSLHLPRLRAMIRALRDALGQECPLILVGGRPFIDRPDLAVRVGADFSANGPAEAIALLAQQFAAV